MTTRKLIPVELAVMHAVTIEAMVQAAAEALTHEIAAKLGVTIDRKRALDLARNVVQAQLGCFDGEEFAHE